MQDVFELTHNVLLLVVLTHRVREPRDLERPPVQVDGVGEADVAQHFPERLVPSEEDIFGHSD